MLREIRKFFVAIFVGVFATALLASPVNALNLTTLEKTSPDTESIEINTPSEGYDFDANFLAKDQELSYKATIINDEGSPIKVSAISLNSSTYDFLEYSYSGIEIDDTLESGETKDIILTIKTNSNNTQTVSEDYDLSIDYTKIEPVPGPDTPTPPSEDIPTPDEPVAQDDNPNTSATTTIKTAAGLTISVITIVLIFVRNKKIRNYAIIFTVSSLGAFLLFQNSVNAEGASNFHIKGKVSFVNIYIVTVNPNGGIYNNTTENTVVRKREGETYHVGEVSRENYDFIEWEVNPGELDNNNDIEIHADTLIKAKWNEVTYTLTIKPNGGKYNGSEEIYTESFRPNEVATISSPSKEGYDFKNWTVEEGSIGSNGVFTGSSITMTENVTLQANYDIKRYTVTVIPNGGTYHDSTNTYTTTVDWNTDYQIEPITRQDYELQSWTKTIGDTTSTLSADTESINIKADTTIEANWLSSIYYTVTIDPNGGTYDDSTAPSQYQVRNGDEYELLEATREGWGLEKWVDDSSNELAANTEKITVTGDITLTAQWFKAVAQIVRTGKVYPSIMAAHADANPGTITGDTILLLVDTTEIVTNSKDITLNLGGRTVTGYLINSTNSNLTLINGTFDNYGQNENDANNTNGAALINNGTLTMGVNDCTDGTTVSACADDTNHALTPAINHDYVKLYGNHYGLEQNGTFDYYDGQIEGEIGLKGGYRNSPWFRKMSDGTDIHYFPLVTKNNIKNQQHVQLENASMAISKTVTDGEIYYYNLQDNINASAETGYKIYIVRGTTEEPVPASYDITVDNGDTIIIDLDGHTIANGGFWINNGTLTFTDSNAKVDNKLFYSKTFTNNGTLNLTNLKLEADQPNLLMSNAGTLNLTNSKLTSTLASTLELAGDNAALNADANSEVSNYYTGNTSGIAAIVSNATNAEINGGNYIANGKTITNQSSKKLTINSGSFTTTAQKASEIIYSEGNLVFNGGTVSYDGSSSYSTLTGIHIRGTATINGGFISIKNTSVATAIDTAGTTTINSGTFIATSTSQNATTIKGDSNTIIHKGLVNADAPSISASSINSTATGVATAKEISDVTITVTTNKSNATGVSGVTDTINNATISATVTTNNGTAIGVNNGQGTISNSNISAASADGMAYGVRSINTTIESGTITATSNNNNAYGCYANTNNTTKATISGGTITATTNNGNKLAYGAYADYGDLTITGGTIAGTDFGVTTVRGDQATIIGVLDDTLNKDQPIIKGGDYGVDAKNLQFYDGTLVGGTDYALNHDDIKTIPSGADYHKETDSNGDLNCWLVAGSNFLTNTRLPNSAYNSFDAAYNDEHFQDGDTLQVTEDHYTEALQAANDHTVTIDLNGKKLTLTQTLVNNGTMTITDSAPTKGMLRNTGYKKQTVKNNGTLTITNSRLSGLCTPVDSVNERTYVNNEAIQNYLTISNSTIVLDESSSTCNSVVKLGNSIANINQNSVIKSETDSYSVAGISLTGASSELTVNNSDIRVTSAKQTVYGIQKSSNNGGHKIKLESGNIYVLSGVVDNDGNFTATTGTSAYGISSNENVTIGTEGSTNNTTPTITVIARNGAYGTTFLSVMHNGKMTVHGYSTTYGVYASNNNVEIRGGEITATSDSYDSYGVSANILNLHGGSISSHTNSTSTRVSYAATTNTLTMESGSLSATRGENAKEAIGAKTKMGTVTGGTIYGQDYGIQQTTSDSRYPLTLGDNADSNALDKDAFTITGGLYGIKDGYVYFYDGTIIGKDDENYDYVSDRGIIKAIPSGATYNITRENGQIKCWLITATNFLYNPRLDQEYNSFNDAFTDEHLQDGDEIRAIENNTSDAEIPENTHTITLNLNGKTIINSQPIVNSGTLTITDSLGNGVLESSNSSDTAPAIYNTGTLNVQSGTIVGAHDAIKTTNEYYQTGGTVKALGGKANAAIYGSGTIEVTNGTIIAENNDTNEHPSLHAIQVINGNNNTVTITDSTITVNNTTIAYGLQDNTTWGTVSFNINGNTTITVNGKNSVYGISGKTFAKKTQGTNKAPRITVSGSSGDIYGISATSSSEINDTTIIAESTYNGNVYGVANAKIVEDSNITVKVSDDNTANYTKGYGIKDAITVTNNTINVTVPNEAYGIVGTCSLVINSGDTTVKSTNNNAYAYSVYSSNLCNGAQIKGGTASATTEGDGKLAYGLHSAHNGVVITGGSISGQHYGIYATDSYEGDGYEDYPVVLGEDDGVIYNGVDNDTISPLISGGAYGVYGGYIKFYDGRIRGGTTAYFDRNIKAIATNSYMHMTTETGYDEVKYVSTTEPLAKIGTGSCEPTVTAGTTCYPSLQAAIDDAQNSDTVTLVKDNYVFSKLNIPTEKSITIELDGNTIITGLPIENKGTATIQNSKANSTVLLDYHAQDYFVINTGTLTFKNVSIKANGFIDNKSGANLTLDGVKLSYEEHGQYNSDDLIQNAGNVTIQNSSTISANTTDEYTIYQTAGSTTINNSEITTDSSVVVIKATGGSVTLDKAKLTSNVTSTNAPTLIRQDTGNVETIIRNGSTLKNGVLAIDKGTLTFTGSTLDNSDMLARKTNVDIEKDTEVEFNNSTLKLSPQSNNSTVYGTIENDGTLKILNKSKVSVDTDKTEHKGAKYLISNNKSLTIDDSEITLNSHIDNDNYTTYGIYLNNENSVTNIENGSKITVNSNASSNPTYGIYAEKTATNAQGIHLGDNVSIEVNAAKAHGVYVHNGMLVMGSKAQNNNGAQIANMNYPLVKAISTAETDKVGIGIEHIGGTFDFYDGKIIGTTSAYTATITDAEHWYEPTKEFDNTNGYEVGYLKYMPNGSDQGGQ